MVEIYSKAQASQIRDVPTLIELYHGHRRRAFKQGRGPGWAYRTFYEQCDREPHPTWCYGSLFGARPTWDEQLKIYEYLREHARGKDAGAWMIAEFEKEVGPGSWFKLAEYKSGLEDG